MTFDLRNSSQAEQMGEGGEPSNPPEKSPLITSCFHFFFLLEPNNGNAAVSVRLSACACMRVCVCAPPHRGGRVLSACVNVCVCVCARVCVCVWGRRRRRRRASER